MCRVFYTVNIVAEIYAVQVHFQYLVFGISLLDGAGEPYFAHFAHDRFFGRKVCVFDKLLRDCGSAFFCFHACDIRQRGSRHTERIHRAVLIKTSVLYGKKCVGRILSDILKACQTAAIGADGAHHGSVLIVKFVFFGQPFERRGIEIPERGYFGCGIGDYIQRGDAG